MTELLIESGVPGEAVQIVTGRGSLVGKYLVPAKELDAISFTGSTEIGIQIQKKASNQLHRVFLELGGNDAFIVFDDADIDYAVNEALWGKLLKTGQTCCASKRFIVQNTIKDQFTKKLVERLEKVKIGNSIDPDTELSCLISEKAAKEVEEQVKFTIDQGAKCAYGGKRFNKTFFQPAVLTNVTKDMDIAKDLEIFGPVFPIIGFDSIEEAIEIENSSKYGLMGGVISNDIKKCMKVASKLQCGGVVINGSGAYRTIEMPFGGYKMSGLGREGASHTLEEMTQEKTLSFKGIYK